MKKRFLPLALALILCLALIPGTAFAAGSGTLSLDKNAYMPNEEIIVTFSGITQQMIEADAYISIYKKGAGHKEYMSWNRPEAGSGQMTFRAPAELGAYEMRLYNEDHKYTADTFVMSVPFTVSMQKQGSISLEKSAYQAQQEISVTVTGITPEMVATGAFVSIYKKGAAHNAYGTYQYPKAGDSVVQLKAPNENGEFEMRLYSIDHNYSDESFVMSVPFTLSGAVVEQEPQPVSSWAKPEVEKADQIGLIPPSLKSADLTKPITREEFAELGVRLYEEATGTAAAAVSPNPFTDTSNPEILKAFKLGVTNGTSATAFSPKVPINREQCAAMLFRTINAIHPGGDYSITGIPDFPDQKSISAYAVPATKYMSKLGIVKGDAKGYFMPKATTTAQTAAGYGMATREAAILMSVRTYDKVDEIKATKAPAVPETPAPVTPPADPQTLPAANSSVVGTWVLGTLSGGTFHASTGKYEGGASGLGQIYTFKADGAYSALSVWSESIWITGKYSVKDGILTLTGRASEESKDGGKTWSAKETLPDASAYFTAGTDDGGKYLLMGEEGAKPPLVDKENALKYKSAQ